MMQYAGHDSSCVELRGSPRPYLVVIVPFQNEEKFLPRLLASIDRQTRPPDRLILVDDGSSDGSAQIARAYAHERPLVDIVSRPGRAKVIDRLAEAPELNAFQWALAQVCEPWNVVGKLDADLELNPTHFEYLLDVLAQNPDVGIAGAHLSDVRPRGTPIRQPSPTWHVHGATKFYRRECYVAIQPIPLHLGWDMIDGAKARMAGWKTVSVELPGGDTLHLRPTGAHDGRLRAFGRWGECAWGYGSHPSVVVLGAVRRMKQRPYLFGGIFYACGYLRAGLGRRQRATSDVVNHVRREQVERARAAVAVGFRAIFRSSERLRRSKERLDSKPRLHAVCSRGGHLDLLVKVADALAGYEWTWFVQRSARSEVLRASGHDVRELGDYDGRLAGRAMLATIWHSLRAVLSERPRLVVTSGAGMTVPFCVFARLLGARVIFVETSARVYTPSASGRVLSRIASDVIAQWPEMTAVYESAVIARSSILEEVTDGPTSVGDGTFVSLGTHSQSFGRLLDEVGRAFAAEVLPEPAFLQTGSSAPGVPGCQSTATLPPREVGRRMRRAHYVVCHAGTGTIAAALRSGKRPLVMPRLQRFGEHFDDHQQQIVEKLSSLNLLVPLTGQITRKHLLAADEPLHVPDEYRRLPSVAVCIEAAIVRTLGRPAKTSSLDTAVEH